MKKAHALQICPFFSSVLFTHEESWEREDFYLLYLRKYHEYGEERLRLEMVLTIPCVPKVKRIL